jgi:hypothetical protein
LPRRTKTELLSRQVDCFDSLDVKALNRINAKNVIILMFYEIFEEYTSYSREQEYDDAKCAEVFPRSCGAAAVAHIVSFRSGPVDHRKICVSFWKVSGDGIKYTTPTNPINSWRRQLNDFIRFLNRTRENGYFFQHHIPK